MGYPIQPLFYKGKIGVGEGDVRPEKLPVNVADPVVRVFERLIPRLLQRKVVQLRGSHPLAGSRFTMHTPHLNLAARILRPLLYQALMDGGLVTARIHQGLICSPLDTHRYLVLPGLIGGSPQGVGDPDQQSHLHHGTVVLEVPRVPASPAGRPRPYRHPRGRRVGKGLPERVLWRGSGLCPPPPLAGGNGRSGHSHSVAGLEGPPAAATWDWARERRRWEGREAGSERQRERLGRGSPTPGHAARWSSASWMAWASDVGRWHWTHSAVRRGSRATNCSSTTRSITPSTSRGSAKSHLRHASRSC